MELSLSLLVILSLLFAGVAFMYSAVGHGGASGYLAILSLFAFAPKEMSTTALLLNILVATISFIAFYRAGYFSLRLTLPFLLSSIPFAFLGGLIYTSSWVYSVLLSAALSFAALRLFLKLPFQKGGNVKPSSPRYVFALPIGGAIGFVSGIVGVGGGIFLSPIILLMQWSDPKHASATAALFIVLNSLAGILGRQLSNSISFGNFLPLLIAAAGGGILGSWWGAKKFSNLLLQRLLGVVLLIAATKLIITIFN